MRSMSLVAALPNTEYFSASSVDDAIRWLDKYQGKARVIAGGTDIIRLMKNDIVRPEALINIKTIYGISSIQEDGRGLKIGALATLEDIERSILVKSRYGILAEAAKSVAAPTLRRMSTLAGNLCQETQCWYYRRPPSTGKIFICHKKGGNTCFAVAGENADHAIIDIGKCAGVCPSDMATALAALGASLEIAGRGGARTVAMDKFYNNLGNALKADEIITEIVVPPYAAGTRQKFIKFRLRKAIDFAISSAAVVLVMPGDKISHASVVLGGVAPTPYRAVAAQNTLAGQVLTEDLAKQAGKAAVAAAKPLGKNGYKVPITSALTCRAIMSAN